MHTVQTQPSLALSSLIMIFYPALKPQQTLILNIMNDGNSLSKP